MKRLGKKMALFCSVAVCSMMLFAVNDMNVCASEDAGVETYAETRSTNLEWVYATIDGVLYMRLYNHSTGEWLTDWILAY